MELTLGDIGDLFKMAHSQALEIRRLNELVANLENELDSIKRQCVGMENEEM